MVAILVLKLHKIADLALPPAQPVMTRSTTEGSYSVSSFETIQQNMSLLPI